MCSKSSVGWGNRAISEPPRAVTSNVTTQSLSLTAHRCGLCFHFATHNLRGCTPTHQEHTKSCHTHTHTQHSSTPTEDKAAQRVVLSLHSCSSLAYIIIFCFAAALAVDLYTLWICESKQRAQNDDIIWRVQYLCTTRQSWQFTMLSLFLSEPVKLILDALFAVKTLSYVGGMFQ